MGAFESHPGAIGKVRGGKPIFYYDYPEPTKV
jgi:hypothetical protein